jgi:hypothetical protein
MATLALFAVGSAIGASTLGTGVVAFGLTGAAIGGFVGGSIGSFIDSTYLFPAIFGRDNLSGPRLTDQPVMTNQRGAPMHWILGPRSRVGGTVIWKSPLIEQKSTVDAGKGGISGPSASTYSYSVDMAIGVCDTKGLPDNRIGRVVKIYADAKVIYDGSSPDTTKYDGITIYDGSQTTSDPTIVSYEGEENTYPFKKTCYIVINRLKLADYGNRIPNISVVVEQENPFTLQDAISLIMQRAGYDTSEFSVNRLDQCLNGYIVSGPQEMGRALAPLMLAFNVNVQERDGVINFIPKGDEDRLVVDMNDLAASSPESRDAPRLLDVTDVDNYDLPSEVAVRYYDHTLNLEQGSQRKARNDHVQQNRVTLDLPITLDGKEALNIATRYLWAAEAERQRVELVLPPKYLGLREGMTLVLPDYMGREREVWVRKVAVGHDYRVMVEGMFYDPDVYDVDSVVDETDTDDAFYQPGETVGVVVDMPALTPSQEDRVGLYYVVCNKDRSGAWRGAQLWDSTNNIDFDKEVDIGVEATIGLTTGGYMNPLSRPHRWDRSSHLDILTYDGGLSSASESEVLSGANRLALQSATGEYEIVAFANSELLETGKYRISTLLRGLRGTDHLIPHQTGFGRIAVLGEASSLRFIERPYGDNSYWKFPAVGGLVSDYESQRALVSARTLRPFSPCNLRGEYNEDEDLVISWTRRMKYARGIFSEKVLPADETPETYEVDILSGSILEGSTVVRTIEVTEATTVTYDAGTIASDGFIPGYPIGVAVYQVSQVAGRGPGAFRVMYSNLWG